jgi:hypothetical protein
MVLTRTQRSLGGLPRSTHSFLHSMLTNHSFILILVCEYLSLQDIILSLSSSSKTFSSLITLNSDTSMIIWRHLLLRYFPKHSLRSSPSTDPNYYQEFLSLASIRIWNWDSLFHSRIFWAQVFFTLNQYFEDHLIFGASFSSSSKNYELQKLHRSDFDDWDDGHNLIFTFPEGYRLCYQISDHTMGTWTLETNSNPTEQDDITICRLDGHPLLPGFTYLQAEILIKYLSLHSSCLLFDSSFLWPLFFPFIELSSKTSPYCDQLIKNLRTSGWRSLRLPLEKWKKLEDYIRERCEMEVTSPSFFAKPMPLLSSLCQLLQTHPAAAVAATNEELC